MRYKELVLKKLEQLEFTVNGLKGEVSRNTTRDKVLADLDKIKEKIVDLTGTVSLEN